MSSKKPSLKMPAPAPKSEIIDKIEISGQVEDSPYIEGRLRSIDTKNQQSLLRVNSLAAGKKRTLLG